MFEDAEFENFLKVIDKAVAIELSAQATMVAETLLDAVFLEKILDSRNKSAIL